MKLLQTANKIFYNNFGVKNITGNKFFQKTLKLNFTDKTLKNEMIALVEDGKTILEEPELAKLFNNYCGSIVEGLGLECPEIS